MSEKNDGGLPVSSDIRDWFAGVALGAIIGKDVRHVAQDEQGLVALKANAAAIATGAYIYADAMLKAREA